MRLLVVFPLFALCASAYYFEPKTAEKDFLVKQKQIYNLLYHVSQPDISQQPYEIGKNFKIEENLDNYGEQANVKEFLAMQAQGFLPRGALFSTYYEPMIRESYYLFKLFYYAKDFETFYNTACWARIYMNEGLFCCSLYNAVLRREDTRYIQLPPPYEMYPYAYYDSEVMEKVHHAQYFGKLESKKSSGMDAYIIPANYTGWYLQRDYDYETKLNYYTQDVGLNAYYFFLRQDSAYWFNSKKYNLPSANYRGVEYLYSHRQLMNRYYLERLSNDLAKVEDFDWSSKFYPGFYPTMNFHNGLPLPQRPQWTNFPYYKLKYIRNIREMETRISAAIDSGFAWDASGKMINIYTPEGLNLLGNMIEGNADSCNRDFYGSIDKFARKILGFGLEPINKNQIAPGALEMLTMSLRDPAFFRMYKRIVEYYEQYKLHMQPYNKEDIVYSSLKIESFVIDKLFTYFDQFDASISNGLMLQNREDAEKALIKIRQYRLNHKPFSFHFTVSAEKKMQAAIRIFLGPKYDPYKKIIDFDRARKYFYEIDNFIVDLNQGSNKIVRNSQDCFFVMPDAEPSEELYKRLLKALNGGESFSYMPRVFGFPDRLLLPRGRKEGFPLQIFVQIAPVENTVEYKSRVFGEYKFDNRAFGYPLDRPTKDFKYDAGNMVLKDIVIFHKDELDVNIAA